MEVLGTDIEFQGTVFSDYCCLWKNLEQIFSFKELLFLILLFVEVLRTDSEYQGAVFSDYCCLWKYSEQILSLVELFYRILFVCGSTWNKF